MPVNARLLFSWLGAFAARCIAIAGIALIVRSVGVKVKKSASASSLLRHALARA